MKKLLVLLLSCLLLTAALTACTQPPAETPTAAPTADPTPEAASLPEPEQLAQELLASGAFSDLEAEPAAQKVGLLLYGLEEAAAGETAFYFSSGATAEELAVFRCADADSAQAVAGAAQLRLDRQAASFADYAPAEVPKLESAAVRVQDNVVVVCVAADNALRDAVLDRYF